MLSGFKRVVFFGCHTDDEMVCAGTLHRLAKMGADVRLVTFAPAATVDDRLGSQDSVNIVQMEWSDSICIIGASRWSSQFHAIAPSSDLHPHRQRIKQLAYDYCEGEKPDAAFILSPEDENTAHRIVAEECESVTRGRVPVVIRCQFPWNYGIGRNNLFIRLDPENIEAKLGVIRTYRSQHFRYRYEEMFSAYCRGDGLSLKTEWVEKFELVRGVL